MPDLRPTFASLLKEALSFLKELQNQGYDGVYVQDPQKWASNHTLPQPLSQIEPLFEPTVELPPAKKNASIAPSPVSKKNPATPLLEAKWALIPSPPADESKTLYHRFEPLFPKEALTVPPCYAYLLLSEEDPACRLFLENVAKAMTRTLAPTCVALASEKKWESWFVEPGILVVIPLSLVKKKIPQAHAHHFYLIGSATLLPLEELECYIHDTNLKRTLWNTLKTFHFQNMLLSP